MEINLEDSDKKFFKMGEVSAYLDVAPSKLRFWEKEFTCLKNLQKNRKGDRFYTAKNIQDLKTIHYLVTERGYTLQGANEYMNGMPEDGGSKLEMLESLKKVRAFLMDLKENL